MSKLILAALSICRFVLAGDSTLGNSTGYGAALCRDVRGQCLNYARGGASMTSFLEEGLWTRLLATVTPGTVVLIEFGHNDRWAQNQNQTSNFEGTLKRYIDDVRDRGGVPIIATPLSERKFSRSRLIDSLQPWAELAETTAVSKGAAVLPLHSDSKHLIETLGPVASMELAQLPPTPEQKLAAATGTSPDLQPLDYSHANFDYTHVGPYGSELIAKMVEKEFIANGYGHCFR